MFKKTFAAAAALSLSAPAAFAGPYLNWETNASYSGSDFGGATHEAHIGYEGASGNTSYYIQMGPAIVNPDGAEAEIEFSGKVGGAVAVSEQTSIYGELGFVTSDFDNGYGAKAGVKYSF